MTAVKNLTDQALLAKLALEDKELAVRLMAVERLVDEHVLSKLRIDNWMEKDVRGPAVGRLDEQAVFAKVATEDKYWGVRRAAVERLDNQAVLGKVAAEDEELDVRLTAVRKLTDQVLLSKLADIEPRTA